VLFAHSGHSVRPRAITAASRSQAKSKLPADPGTNFTGWIGLLALLERAIERPADAQKIVVPPRCEAGAAMRSLAQKPVEKASSN
jgi:hypothetical protein